MTVRPKQHARIGMFHLEEAILDVLLDARHEDECIGAAGISRRTGIHREAGPTMNMNDAIVHGCLNKMEGEGRVQRCQQENNRGGWELTEREFASRRDDT